MTIQKIIVVGAPKSGKTELCEALERRLDGVDHGTPTPVQVLDSQALLAAVVSDLFFSDDSLYAEAVKNLAGNTLTLLTGLESAHHLHATGRAIDWSTSHATARLQQRIDQGMRAALALHGVSYCCVYAGLNARVETALQALAFANAARLESKPSDWCWSCEKCSDAACEHQMFSRLIGQAAVRSY